MAGDLVVVKDDESTRNDWPMGLVHGTFGSSDGLVRKVFTDKKRVLCVILMIDLVTLLEVDE
jgi:hypothetical protein